MSDQNMISVQLERIAEPTQYISPCIDVLVVNGGTLTVTAGNKSYAAARNDVFLFDAYDAYYLAPIENAEVMRLSIGSRYVSDFSAAYSGHVLMTEVKENAQAISDLVMQIYRKQDDFNDFDRRAYANLVFSAIVRADAIIKSGSKPHQRIGEITKYIFEHSEQKLTLNSLAALFGYAPMSLSHLISRNIGTDLRTFINDVRVQKAHAMLQNPENRNCTIAEIAATCGFTCTATFYRAYDRRYGTAPKRN